MMFTIFGEGIFKDLTVQVILMPISFGLLFSLMLLYWGQAAIFSYTKLSKITTTVLLLCIISLTSLLISRSLDSGHLPLSNLYESLLFLSWSFLAIQLFLQINSKHILNPYTSQIHNNETQKVEYKVGFYEEYAPAMQKRSFCESKALLQDQFVHFLGVITSPMSLLIYGFASLNLPKEMQKATSLVPALQSNWLMMHVTVMILSYAALLCGSIFSMAFLFLNFLDKRNSKDKNKGTVLQKRSFCTQNEVLQTLLAKTKLSPSVCKNEVFAQHATHESKLYKTFETEGSVTPFLPFKKPLPALQGGGLELNRGVFESFVGSVDNNRLTENPSLSDKIQGKRDTEYKEETAFTKKNLLSSPLSLADKLDNYSYRVLALGFPLLTVGILSGAVWANQAWGSYWSWDPKESWALITWLVFAIYLHARITKGLSGEKPAIIATFGFFVIWFCYLGVNLLGTGLHSYGWFAK